MNLRTPLAAAAAVAMAAAVLGEHRHCSANATACVETACNFENITATYCNGTTSCIDAVTGLHEAIFCANDSGLMEQAEQDLATSAADVIGTLVLTAFTENCTRNACNQSYQLPPFPSNFVSLPSSGGQHCGDVTLAPSTWYPLYAVFWGLSGSALAVSSGHTLTLPPSQNELRFFVVSAAFFSLALLLFWSIAVVESIGAWLARPAAPQPADCPRAPLHRRMLGQFLKRCAELTIRNDRVSIARHPSAVRRGAAVGVVIFSAAAVVLLCSWAMTSAGFYTTVGSTLPWSLNLLNTWASDATLLSENVSNATVGVVEALDEINDAILTVDERLERSINAATNVLPFESGATDLALFSQNVHTINRSVAILTALADQLIDASTTLEHNMKLATSASRRSIDGVNVGLKHATGIVMTFCWLVLIASLFGFLYYHISTSTERRMLKYARDYRRFRMIFAPLFHITTLLLLILCVIFFVFVILTSTLCVAPNHTIESVVRTSGVASNEIPITLVEPHGSKDSIWVAALTSVPALNRTVRNEKCPGQNETEFCIVFNNSVAVGELARFYIDCGQFPQIILPLRPTFEMVEILLCVATVAAVPAGHNVLSAYYRNLLTALDNLRDTIMPDPLTVTGNQPSGLTSALACQNLNHPVESVENVVCKEVLPELALSLMQAVLLLLVLLLLELFTRFHEAAVKTKAYEQLVDQEPLLEKSTGVVVNESYEGNSDVSFADHDYVVMYETSADPHTTNDSQRRTTRDSTSSA